MPFIFCAIILIGGLTTAKMNVLTFKNNIEFASGAKNSDVFFEKLKKLKSDKKGKIHILQIGDSHIQSDIKGSVVRSALQKKYGNAGYGWFFPYSLMNSNNPVTFTCEGKGDWKTQRAVFGDVKGSWGLCPVAVSTESEQAEIQFGMKGKNFKHETARLAIFFGGAFSENFSPLITYTDTNGKSKKLSAKKYENSAAWFEADEKFNNFSFFLKKDLSTQNTFICNGFYSENGENGIIYSSAGANGADIAAYLRSDKFEDNIRETAPDFVIISLGTNDCRRPQFSEENLSTNLEILTQRIKNAAPDALIMLTTPPLCRSNDVPDWDKKEEAAVRVIREKAKKSGYLLWDFYNIMQAQKNTEVWFAENFLSKDFLHLTPQGYRIQGEWFAKALLDFMQKK